MTTTTEHEQLLLALEAQVARGSTAIAKRNALMAEMHRSDGKSLQQLANILNVSRSAQGAPTITKHGVLAAIRRHDSKNLPAGVDSSKRSR